MKHHPHAAHRQKSQESGQEFSEQDLASPSSSSWDLCGYLPSQHQLVDGVPKQRQLFSEAWFSEACLQ